VVAPTQIERIVAAPDGELALGPDGVLRFDGQRVARLRAGRTPATPVLVLGGGDPSTRKALHARLDAFVAAWLARHLAALSIDSRDAGVRGLSHALVQGLGSVGAGEFAAVLDALRPRDRKALARAGIRLGREVVYAAAMLAPAAVEARALLTAIHFGEVATAYPVAGAPPAVALGDTARERLPLLGYATLGSWALRHDVYESALALVRRGRSARVGALLGPLEAEAPAIVRALGDRRRAHAR
jgi:ATP-dependent RNA helicase SUPV3L1/SUV3